MNITSQRIVPVLILTFMAQMLLGCFSMSTITPKFISLPGNATPVPDMLKPPSPAYGLAQATIDSGQSQLLDLSRKATELSLNMSRAANAAALSTQEYNQRQKMELDYQSTRVSLSIAQAAATQKFITQQTKMAVDAAADAQNRAAAATANAQSTAAAATHSANLVNVTRTAQAQAMLDAQVWQTAQARAALTAYPLTATPFAVTQAALLMQQYDREQRSFLERVVVPMIPVMVIIYLLLIIFVSILAYRRFRPIPWSRLLRMTRGNVNLNPMTIIEGVIVDRDPQLHRITPPELMPANPPRLPGEDTVHVEIVNATEPPVAHWIVEVEHQLAIERELSH